jgi:hypothetical protein
MVKELPPGSVVLFRYGQAIMGDAVVCKGKEVFKEPVTARTTSGEDEEYAARVTFAPSSIRLYAPPLPIEKIRPFTKKDLMTYAGGYVELDWEVYAHVLREVVSQGSFSV